MDDFTSEDLFDAVDRTVSELLERGLLTSPPVDALDLLRSQFGYRIDYEEPHEAPKYGDRPKRRPGPNEIILPADAAIESQQAFAGKTVAKKIIPAILIRLGVVPGTENKSAQASLTGMVTSRLLLPTRWFSRDARRAVFDLVELQGLYRVPWEMLAWRLLDVDDEPSVVAIVDDGACTARRGNRFAVTRKLTAAEEECVGKVQETDDPAKVRREEWTAFGWPTQGAPFRRIIVRSVPDQL